jgi:uncharacterized protein (DUF1499 family)
VPSDNNGAAWKVRAARNQALFRAINEELKVAIHALDPERLTIACECADPACVETLEVDAEHYAQIRAQPTHFIVLPGHIYTEVEQVIFEDARFQIVEKLDEAAVVAAAADGSASSG